MTAPFRPSDYDGTRTQAMRRSPLGRPAAMVAILLLAAAAYCIWRPLTHSSPGGCGLAVGIDLLASAFLGAAATGVICLDMLIRLME